MSESTKTVVQIVLVKRETDNDGKVTRTFLKDGDGLFTDADDAAVEKTVRFKEHDAIVEAGGPEKVEVLISRPFLR